MVNSEFIVEKVREHSRQLGYNWIKIVEIIPPNGNNNWEIKIDIGISKRMLKVITFDKDGKFISFK